jgi:peptidoglycan hydrolase-like protein with peptidoglycan-binding domain
MTNAHRDLASPELWTRSTDRSRRRRELLPRARRENKRRKHLSAALATAVVAGPGAPLAAAQVSGNMSAAVAAESPANRAIEIREGGLPLRVGSQGDLVAHVQTELGVASDGIFGPQTDAAVRKYQLSSGLDVDGIVGLATWSSLFAQAGASGAAIGGSDIPPQVRQEVSQRLEQAGVELAVQGDTGAGTGLGGQPGSAPPAIATPPAATTPVSRPDATVPTTQAPAGGSCSSATISTPVKGTVTSDFGPRGGRNHDGIDIAAPTGTPVRAVGCGTVSLAGQQSGYGNIVCVTHTSQFSTCYAHLSRFGVSNGAQVQQGQVIGYVGCTGNCTGPHLHFETRVNGQAQNPRSYLSGGSIPGKRAAVAGASSSATKASSTGTAEAVVTGYGTGSTAAATDAAAPAAAEAGTTEAIAVEAQTATPTETVAAEPATAAPTEVAPAEAGTAEAVAVEAEMAAPTEVAPAPAAPAEAPAIAAPEVAPAPVAPAPAAPAEAPAIAAPEVAPASAAPAEAPAVAAPEVPAAPGVVAADTAASAEVAPAPPEAAVSAAVQ